MRTGSAWTRLAQQDPDVLGAAPFIQAQGMVTEHGQVRGITAQRCPAATRNRRFRLSRTIWSRAASNDLKSGEFGIIVGQLLAQSLNLAYRRQSHGDPARGLPHAGRRSAQV